MAKKKNTLSGLNQFRSDTVKLTIYPEFESLIPPLSDEESKNLEEVLLEEGIKDSILYWKPNEKNAPTPEYIGKNLIIDGHNRYKCANKNKLTFKTKEKSFNTIEEVQMWMAKNQLSRRNVTDADRTYLIGLIYNREKEDKGKYTRGAKGQTLPLSKNNNEKLDKPPEQTNRTDEKIANETGTSPRSVRNAGDFAKGIEKLESSLKKEVLSGKEKIPKAKIQKLAKVKGLEKKSLKTKEDIDKVLDKNDPKKPKVKDASLKHVDEHIATLGNSQSKNNKITIGEKYTLAQVSEFSNEIINFIKQKKAGEELTLKAIDMALKYFYDTK